VQQCAADRELVLLVAAAGMDRRLFGDIADRAMADALGIAEHGIPRTRRDFEARLESGRTQVTTRGDEVLRTVKAVLLALKDARTALSELALPAFAEGSSSIARQLEALLAPGWVRDTPAPAFLQLRKYVRAAARRAERLRNDVQRDRRLDAQVAPFVDAWRSLLARHGPHTPAVEAERLRWMIEEFRLSLFAQDLRTLGPVSATRLEQQLRLARAEAE